MGLSTMGSVVSALAGIHAFEGFDKASLEAISQLCVSRNYGSSQTVIAYDETSTSVYFVVSGTVRATMVTPMGREISYQDLGPGDMFGELAAIDKLPRSTHVIALDQVQVLTVTGHDFMSLIADYPEIARATLEKMAGSIRFLADRVYNYGALDVNRRVRAELVRLAGLQTDAGHTGAVEIERMPKHQELANRLATHREAVSRELSVLEKAGVITKKKNLLTIHDLGKLKAMISE